MAAGDELLIVDANDVDREGMRTLFEGDGYVCTAVATAAQAAELVSSKFFPAALIDIDVDGLGAGIELVRTIRENDSSDSTAVVLLTSRRSFDAALDALRLGAVDLVMKRPDQIAHLRKIVGVACDRSRSSDKDGLLLQNVQAVLDEAFKVILGMGRRLYGEQVASSVAKRKTKILMVDSDQAFLRSVAQKLGDRPWEVSAEMTGGAALDKASGVTFDIVTARADLPDLPGAMLIKSIQNNRSETLGLVYSGGANGSVARYVAGRVTATEKELRGPEHVLEVMGLLAREVEELTRERRYLQAFRAEHAAFLKRYAELKLRIDALVG